MPAVVQHAAALGQQRAQSPCRAEVAHHVDATPGASQRAKDGIALSLEIQGIDRLALMNERRSLQQTEHGVRPRG